MRRFKNGFTLVELLVVVSVIAILSAVLYANFNDAKKQSRDAERKSDLRNIQSALELFKNKYGDYPEGCNPAGSWSGQIGTSYVCPGGVGQFIKGRNVEGTYRDFAEFMPVLPADKKLNGVTSGYVYTVNAAGEVYKIMALDTVESEVVSETSEYARCGDITTNTTNECTNVPDSATHAPINGIYNDRGGTKTPCNDISSLGNDYALRGGYASGVSMRAREYYSDIIRCK